MKNDLALKWYKSLDLERRFALKELTKDICGIAWEDFSLLFTPRERINIIYDKLKLEGFYI